MDAGKPLRGARVASQRPSQRPQNLSEPLSPVAPQTCSKIHTQKMSGPKKNHDNHRLDRILRFFSPPRNRAIFSTFWGHLLAKLHSQLGKIHWRKFNQNPVETAPRNCRFLSPVVVERVLKKVPLNNSCDPFSLRKSPLHGPT